MKSWRTFAALAAVLGLCLPAARHADADVSEDRTLSRQAFLAAALENDPDFQSALARYLQTTYDVLSSRAIADWTLRASAGVYHFEAVGSSAFGGTDRDSLRYEIGLQKLFPAAGTRLDLKHGNSLTRADIDPSFAAFLDPEETSNPVTTLAVVQPLLKNAFGLADRYPLAAAALQTQAARHDVREAWENRAAELEKTYLSWVGDHATVRAYRRIVDELARLEAQVRRKYRVGVADEKDWVQAEENLLQYRSRLLQAEGEYVNRRLEIAALMAGAAPNTAAAAALRPVEVPDRRPDAADLPEAKPEELFAVRKLDLLRKQVELQRRVAANDTLPALEAVGEYSVKGQSEDLDGGFAQAAEKQDYSLGLRAELPLAGYRSRGDLGRAEAGLREIDANRDATRRRLAVAAPQLRESIRRMEATLAIQEKLVSKSERKLEIDKEKYGIGRVDIYYLIDSQNGLTRARLELDQNRVRLERMKIDYLALVDRLLEDYPDLRDRLAP